MRRLLAAAAVCALSVTGLAACSGSPPATSSSGQLVRALNTGESATVTYCNGQQADITEPARLDGMAPVAVYVHGGAWVSGDRTTGGFLIDGIGPTLNADGFVTMSIDYRLGPDNQWPAQIEDAKCAVRYLRANAGLLHVNTNEIGVWGHSAGGHLAALVGTAGPSAGWDVGAYTNESSTVQAVVDLAGVSDLLTLGHQGAGSLVTKNFVSLLANVPPDQLQTELTQASPVTWVAHGDPPFLIMHSDDDRIVYAAQSERLAWDLTANGVPNEYVLVHGGGHDFNQPGGSPDPAAITTIVVDFFLRTLVLHQPVGSSSVPAPKS